MLSMKACFFSHLFGKEIKDDLLRLRVSSPDASSCIIASHNELSLLQGDLSRFRTCEDRNGIIVTCTLDCASVVSSLALAK